MQPLIFIKGFVIEGSFRPVRGFGPRRTCVFRCDGACRNAPQSRRVDAERTEAEIAPDRREVMRKLRAVERIHGRSRDHAVNVPHFR